MALYKSKGIVLRSIRYGEADRILDLYTHDYGMVSAIAKGIRRTRSRFGARLEPLSCVDVMAYSGRSLDTVTQAEVLRSFHGVREHLGRLEAAGSMVRNVRALSGGDEGDRRVFNLLYRSLETLEERGAGFKSVEAAFGLKLATLAGYAPELEACMSCGASLEGTEGLLYYAPVLGGILCADCRAETAEAFPLPPGTLFGLRSLVSGPVKQAVLEERLEESARRVVGAHILAHAPAATSLEPRPRVRPA
ncbi:MAG: DNA repair protein RecO [Rubrobacter sp.]|nr:DNA repair protein RecO [Rubrobacter sp.]